MVDDLRLHKAFRAALIHARSGLGATAATELISAIYSLSEPERADLSRRVMQSAISLSDGARTNSTRMVPESLFAEACGFVDAMARGDADELIAHDPFVDMPRNLAEPLAAIGIVEIRKLGAHEAVVELTELGEVVAMVLRAQRIWPMLSETNQSLLGSPCLIDGAAGAEMSIHGLYRLNATRTFRGRHHDAYQYVRTELGRITWVLGSKSS